MPVMEEWRECAEWLKRCRGIAKERQIEEPGELSSLLKDGVVLCNVLRKLKPLCISQNDYSQRPQLCQFLCVKNINKFILTCEHRFGLSKADLFEVDDLYEMRNFPKVLTSLSKLSMCSIAQQSGIPGFSYVDKGNADIYTVNDDDDIYHDQYGEVDEDEDVYSDIMRVAKNSVKKNSDRRPSLPLVVPLTHRDKCIAELVDTERHYVEVLSTMVEGFLKPLKSMLSEDDHQTMFCHLEALLEIHTGFLKELDMATKPSPYSMIDRTIPDCFVMYKSKFVVYGDYCSNLPKAQSILEAVCKRSAAVDVFVKNCEQLTNEGRYRLFDLFPVPFQRVLKYHLLLKEIVKHTEENHRESKPLQTALDDMMDLSLYVNEVKRDNENLQGIMDIQTSILDLVMPEDTSLKDYGHLIKDGPLKINRAQRFVFLFDKVILICKERDNTQKYIDALVLSNYDVEDKPNDKRVFLMKGKSKESPDYTITTTNEDHKRKWMDAIEMAKENVTPSHAHDNGHDFVMTTFDKPCICDFCKKLLRGVFFQGYKCQLTQKVMHKECLGKADETRLAVRPPKTLRTKTRAAKPSYEEVVLPNGRECSGGPEDYSNLPSQQNLSMNYYSWYVGEMTKEDADVQLQNEVRGTFLVRKGNRGLHSISIKNDKVNHMHINDHQGKYTFDRRKCFSSIPDLVEHFERNSLKESFPAMDMTLGPAYKSLQQASKESSGPVRCRALYDYAASQVNQISIHEGDIITILDRKGESRGWWKGNLNGKIGYFPMAYVQEL